MHSVTYEATMPPIDPPARTPRILVLLAAFNGVNWIDGQITSILKQRDVDVHIVVGDDASTDNTKDAVKRFSHSDRITLIARTNPTGSGAQNFFAMIREIGATSFDFVAFADQDDIWCEYKLSRATQMLISEGSVGYASSTTAVWPDGTSRVLRQSPAITDSDFLFEGAGQGCTYVMTADFYERARVFLREHETLTTRLHYHDWSIYALARAWMLRWVFDLKSTMQYRQHDHNDTGARSSISGIRNRLSRLASGWYADQISQICRLTQAADPNNTVPARWAAQRTGGFRRRLSVALFCLRGGRRKLGDNALLIGAALLGWI